MSEKIVSFSYFRYGHPKDPRWNENDLLTKAEYLAYNKINGPEAIAFSSNGTSLYTGLRNGIIVRIDNDTHIENIVNIVDELDEKTCDSENRDFIAMSPCGRPFGLKIKPKTNYLYVSYSFYGIVKINVVEKTKKILLASNDTRFGLKPLKSTEDLDLDGDLIYFVDSSYAHDINEAIRWYDIEEEQDYPGGRLFRYDEKNDKLELLLENLYYPNGIVLTPNKDAVIINEFSMARIIKFYLNGPKKGKKEIFTVLPGFSEAIRLTDHDTLLVPFVAVLPANQTMLSFLGQFSFFRALLGYLYSPQAIVRMLPKYGLLAEFDLDGNVLKTWHDKTGEHVSQITNAVLHNNKLYLGSFNKNYIAVVDY